VFEKNRIPEYGATPGIVALPALASGPIKERCGVCRTPGIETHRTIIMTISLDDTVTRAPNLAQRLFEERMLVISARDSMLHRFNEVGTFIWQRLEKERTVTELASLIGWQFEGFDEKKNLAEIERFLLELERKGLVLIGKPRCSNEGHRA
jgi:hypothetical protein